MVITTSVETLDGSWIYCYAGCTLGRAPLTKETLPDFYENLDPDKWDTTVWYRVTQNPQEFYRLTGCQRVPRVFGRHNKYHNRECNFFHFCLSRKIHMSSLYIYIPSFVILYLSSLSRKLFPKRIS